MSYARVQAVQQGQYANIWRDIGDVFDIANASDLSDSTVSMVPVGDPDYPLYGWMKVVPGTTPLYSYALANNGVSSLNQQTYGVDSAGHRILSVPRYVR